MVIGIGIIFARNTGFQVVIIVTADFSYRNLSPESAESIRYQNFQISANIILNSFIHKKIAQNIVYKKIIKRPHFELS